MKIISSSFQKLENLSFIIFYKGRIKNKILKQKICTKLPKISEMFSNLKIWCSWKNFLFEKTFLFGFGLSVLFNPIPGSRSFCSTTPYCQNQNQIFFHKTNFFQNSRQKVVLLFFCWKFNKNSSSLNSLVVAMFLWPIKSTSHGSVFINSKFSTSKIDGKFFLPQPKFFVPIAQKVLQKHYLLRLFCKNVGQKTHKILIKQTVN